MQLFDGLPPLFGPDISKFQNVVGTNFNLEVFSCRFHNGYRVDENFVANRDRVNANPGVRVKIAYVVPVPGMSISNVVSLARQYVPRDWVIMVDAESGKGFMGPGNNSNFFNSLRESLISGWALLGIRRRVFGYANGGDWASCWPQRGDTPMIVAGYSSHASALVWNPQVIGWQYSDGEAKYGVPPGWPRGAQGIGNCDMNVFGFRNGTEMASWLGGGSVSVSTAIVQPPPFVQTHQGDKVIILQASSVMGLLSGSKLVRIRDVVTVQGLQAGGVPVSKISDSDYVGFTSMFAPHDTEALYVEVDHAEFDSSGFYGKAGNAADSNGLPLGSAYRLSGGSYVHVTSVADATALQSSDAPQFGAWRDRLCTISAAQHEAFLAAFAIRSGSTYTGDVTVTAPIDAAGAAVIGDHTGQALVAAIQGAKA